MASAGHDSEQTRQAQDVRLVVDTIPTSRGPLVRAAPLSSSISVRSTIPAEYFVKRYAEKAGKQISKIDRNTLELCQSYHWPGNVRELKIFIAACARESGDDAPDFLRGRTISPGLTEHTRAERELRYFQPGSFAEDFVSNENPLRLALTASPPGSHERLPFFGCDVPRNPLKIQDENRVKHWN
jgi:hypothetical protein